MNGCLSCFPCLKGIFGASQARLDRRNVQADRGARRDARRYVPRDASPEPSPRPPISSPNTMQSPSLEGTEGIVPVVAGPLGTNRTEDIYEPGTASFDFQTDEQLLCFMSHISNLGKEGALSDGFHTHEMTQSFLSAIRCLPVTEGSFLSSCYEDIQESLFFHHKPSLICVKDIIQKMKKSDFKELMVSTGYKKHSTKLYIGRDADGLFCHYIDLGPGVYDFGYETESGVKVKCLRYPINSDDVITLEKGLQVILDMGRLGTESSAAIPKIQCALNSFSKESADVPQIVPEIRIQTGGYWTFESLMGACVMKSHYNGAENPREEVFNSVISPIYKLVSKHSKSKCREVDCSIGSGCDSAPGIYIYDFVHVFLDTVSRRLNRNEYVFCKTEQGEFCISNIDGNVTTVQVPNSEINKQALDLNSKGVIQKNLYTSILENSNTNIYSLNETYGTGLTHDISPKKTLEIPILSESKEVRAKIHNLSPGDFIFQRNLGDTVTKLHVRGDAVARSAIKFNTYSFEYIHYGEYKYKDSVSLKYYKGLRHILQDFEARGLIRIPLSVKPELASSKDEGDIYGEVSINLDYQRVVRPAVVQGVSRPVTRPIKGRVDAGGYGSPNDVYDFSAYAFAPSDAIWVPGGSSEV